MRFVLTNPLAPDGMKLLEENQIEIFTANSPDLASYLDEIQKSDGLIIRNGSCTAQIIDSCPNLKVIGRTGVGVDNIDVERATKTGIPVVITPGANSLSVAEHTVALMFAAAKNICEGNEEIRGGNWNIRDCGKAFELAGKRVGIIGVGSIGSQVARICKALGMETAGYSHSHNRKKVEAAGCEYYADFCSLLRDCDFITIHNPLTLETKNMIAMPELREMKSTAVLINTSRGPIVNEHDLAEALNTGIIAAAGVDVYDGEIAAPENPLFSALNCTCTPHSAALTREAANRMGYKVAEGCIAVCKGAMWQDVANKSVYEQRA